MLLQSRWSLWFAGARTAALLLRTSLEDAWLQRTLPGYTAYAARVRYRLVPGVW